MNRSILLTAALLGGSLLACTDTAPPAANTNHALSASRRRPGAHGGAGGNCGTGPVTGGSTSDGGSGVGVGGAGGSGGDSCIGCGTYVFNDAASVEDVCGFISETDGVLDCDADSSCALLKAVGDCTCSETGCATECADSCAGTGAADEACTDCSLEKCGAETNACIGDQ